MRIRLHWDPSVFLDEITELLTALILKYNNLMITGDFNMHIDDITNAENLIFKRHNGGIGVIKSKDPTHRQGNILDLIYIVDNSQLKYRNCQTHGFISDHAIVTIEIYLHKEKSKPTTKKIHNNEKITTEALKPNFEPPIIDENTGLSQAYNQLKTRL